MQFDENYFADLSREDEQIREGRERELALYGLKLKDLYPEKAARVDRALSLNTTIDVKEGLLRAIERKPRQEGRTNLAKQFRYQVVAGDRQNHTELLGKDIF